MSTTAQFLPTVIASDESTWADHDNVKLDDGSVSTATLSRSINYPVGYSSSPTGYLSAQSFTGITGDFSANDTVDGFDIEIKAKCSNAAMGVALSVQVTQDGTPESQLLTETMAVYTFGGFDSTFDVPLVSRSGLAAAAANVLVSAAATIGTGSTDVSIDYIKMRLWWSNTACTDFTFTPQSGVALGDWIYSNAITIAGLPGGFVAPTYFNGDEHDNSLFGQPLSDAQICKNGDGKWMTHYNAYGDGQGSVNGDSYQIRRRMMFARATDDFASSYGLYIHGPTRYFTMTTVPVDISPTTTFAPRATTLLPINALVKAPFTFRIDGVNTIVRGVGGETSVNCAISQFSPSTTVGATRITDTANPFGGATVRDTGEGGFDGIYNGSDIEYWVTTSPSYGTGLTTDGWILGDQTPTWTFTTVPATLTPTQAYWATPAAVGTSVVTTAAAAITMAGINGTAAVTFVTSGGTTHEFSKNGGAWTAVGGGTTVVNGDTINVRMVSPGAGSQTGNIVMKVNGATGMNAAFTIVTTGGSATPSAFAFTNVTSVAGLSNTSNTQTLAGLTAAQPILATVSPGFQIKNGAGAFTDGSVSCVNGDVISIKGTAPLQPGTVATCVVTVGGRQVTWTITSRAAGAFWD